MREQLPKRAIKVQDRALDPSILQVLHEARRAVGADGWAVRVERTGTALSFEFRSPLSPVQLGLGLGPNPHSKDLGRRLRSFLKDEEEFSRVPAAQPPPKKRRLLGAMRGGAASYGWSTEMFGQVVDLLYEARVIGRAEWDWLKSVGPAVNPSWLSPPSPASAKVATEVRLKDSSRKATKRTRRRRPK